MEQIHGPGLTDEHDRFRSIYADAYSDVLRFVARRVPPSQGEDVAAEVFLVVWRRMSDMPPERNPGRAWIFGVARQTILNTHRGIRRREALQIRLADPSMVPLLGDTSNSEVLVRRVDLARAWPRLAAVDQEALALAYWDGLTSTEAANVLNISPVAFRLRLTRARRHLRRHLDLVERELPSLLPMSEWSPS
jgi:RNA polymerase sigma-70 factor (ECF subfamily)